MNFTFTITAHGFEKAAQIEKALKALEVPFHTAMSKPIGGLKARKKRTVVDKAMLAIVATAIDKHPDRNDAEISRETGVSGATVGRIRNGQHCLQLKPALKEVKK